MDAYAKPRGIDTADVFVGVRLTAARSALPKNWHSVKYAIPCELAAHADRREDAGCRVTIVIDIDTGRRLPAGVDFQLLDDFAAHVGCGENVEADFQVRLNRARQTPARRMWRRKKILESR